MTLAPQGTRWPADPWFREIERRFGRLWPFAGEGDVRGWLPTIEVRTEEGEVVVAAELPGLKKEDVKVTVEQQALIIQGERRTSTEKTEDSCFIAERSYGKFYRRVPLPVEVYGDRAQANFEEGVLTIRLPVREPAPEATTEVPIA